MSEEKSTVTITEDTFDALIRSVDQFKRRVTWALLICLVGLIVCIGGVYYLAAQNTNRIHDVQQSRLDACNDQNRRHDNTVAALAADITLAEKQHPGQVTQLEARKAETIQLIDALAPHHSCSTQIGSTSGT